jgi:hypothetical protein
MAESATQQIAGLQLELQQLQSQLLGRTLVSKDLSLVALIPKWSGNEAAVPQNEFMDAMEGSARIGNWSDSDKI